MQKYAGTLKVKKGEITEKSAFVFDLDGTLYNIKKMQYVNKRFL